MIDNDPVKRPGQLTFVLYSTCHLQPDDRINHGGIRSLSQGHISEQYIGDYRVPRVNRQLTVVLCILCIFVLVVRTVSILSRLSVSGEAKAISGCSQLRGRRNGIIAALGPTEDHLKPLDPAPTNFNSTSTSAGASKRGRKPSVEESTPVTLSNAAANAQSASASSFDDTSVYLSSPPHESQSGEINTTVAHPEEVVVPVGEPGSQRGTSGSIHQSPPPVIGDPQPCLLQPSYYPIAYFFQRFASVVLAEYLWPSTGFSSYGRRPRTTGRNRLLRSLYGRHPTLFIIVIAADEAVRDLWVLDHALMALNSESIRFTGLGGWVTLEDIKTEIKKLCEESKRFPDSQVVIFLTGHGDECNRMMLPMSKSIDATDLFQLLLEPHDTRSTVPVTILFDICRPGVDPSPEPPEGITLIWTCSPGEAAGAYRLPHGPDSCFLTSLMMTSREKACTSQRPQDAVQIQLNRVTEYLRKLYSIKHSQGGCRWCSSGKHCFEPMPQNVDWKHAQDTNGFLKFTEVLSHTEVAEGVCRWFARNYIFCVANNIPAPRGFWSRIWSRFWPIYRVNEGKKPGSSLEEATVVGSDSGFSPLPKINTSRHGRGANESVHTG